MAAELNALRKRAANGEAPQVYDQLVGQRDWLQVEPDAERAMFAEICLNAGHREFTDRLLDTEWTKVSDDVCGLVGALFLALGNLERARDLLERANSGKTKDPSAHAVNLGRTLLLTGQVEEAIAHIRRGIALAPDPSSLAIQSLVEALVSAGRIEEALAELPDSNDDIAVIEARTQVLAMAGRHDEAALVLRNGLERHPADPALTMLSVDLAQVRGRMGEATAVLNRALDEHPDNLLLWVRLATTALMGQVSPRVREAVERAKILSADGTNFDKALALVASAHVDQELGNIDEARSSYVEALNLHHQLPQALGGLGHLLMQNGNIDEAVSYFEQLRAIVPMQGWSNLIHARKLPDDPAVLEEMEIAARRPSLEGPLRANLMLTVATAWDKKKDYGRAMTLATEANEVAKQLLNYDPKKHRSFIERVISVFTPEFMESRNGWGDSSDIPVFVVGMPRSGTTLTEQILAAHSQVHGAGELGEVTAAVAKLEAWEKHLGSGRAWPECAYDLTRSESQALAAAHLKTLQGMDPRALRIVDKLPHNFEHVGLIKLLFPNARIFHCRRDPRDIATSNYITDYAAKFGGMGFAYDFSWIGEQLVDHDRIMEHWHRVFPGQIMEVRYEQLVENVEGWAKSMIGHLGLEWEPTVLEFQSTDRQVKTASVWQVRQPVYKTSRERWRNYEGFFNKLEVAMRDIPPEPIPRRIPTLDPGAFTRAAALIQSGELRAGADILERVIAECPDHAAAHHFLGIALSKLGEIKRGLDLIARSIYLKPGVPQWISNYQILISACKQT